MVVAVLSPLSGHYYYQGNIREGRWANHIIWFFHGFLNPMMFNSEVSTIWTNLSTCQWCCRNPANRLDVWNPLQNGKSNYCITWCRISSWTVPSISCTQIPLESPSKPWKTPESFSKIPSKTSNNKIRVFENIAPFSNNSFMQKTIRKHNSPTPPLPLPPPHNINKRTSSWKVLEINGFKLIFPLATMASARG